MEEFWWKLPILWKLSQVRRGLLEAAAMMLVLSLGMTGLLRLLAVDPPSADLLETLAQVGATFLIAYVLEVTWLVKASQARPLKERETRLGALLGVGAAALIGIGMALWLAADSDRQQWDWLNEFEFGLVLGPLFLAGMSIVMQPLFTHEWADDERKARLQPAARSIPRPPIRSRQSR